MAVIVGVTEHLSPCRRRAAHEGKRHETRLALCTRMKSLRHRLDSNRCRALLSCRLETNQRILFHRAVLLRWFAIHALRSSRKAESGTVAGRRSRRWRVEWYGVGHPGNGTRPKSRGTSAPGSVTRTDFFILPGSKIIFARFKNRGAAAAVLFIHERVGYFADAATEPAFCSHGLPSRTVVLPRLRDTRAVGVDFRLQWTGFLTDKPPQYGTRRVATLFCADLRPLGLTPTPLLAPEP